MGGTKTKSATATKPACQLFAEQQAALDKLQAQASAKGRKMSKDLHDRIEKLSKSVNEAKVACSDERIYDQHKDKINEEIQNFVQTSMGKLRDGIVRAATDFHRDAEGKKPSNAGFVWVVPDAAVNAIRSFILDGSPAAVIMQRLTGGASNPLAKSLDPKNDTAKTLSTLTANMGQLSTQIFTSYKNFGVTLCDKHPKYWTAIAIDWTQQGRKSLDAAALNRFYNATGIPQPTINFSSEIYIAMMREFNSWMQNGQAQTMERDDGEEVDVSVRDPKDMKQRLMENKDSINKDIDRTVNDSIGFVRDNLQDVGKTFEGWVAGQPSQPNSAALAMDVLAAVAAIAVAVFPPATLGFTIASGVITVAKGPLTDGLDKQKDGAALATKLTANLATTSTQLGMEFAHFGERLFKENPVLWSQIGLALMVPPRDPDPNDPKDKNYKPSKMDGGMVKEADKLLFEKAGVPRMNRKHARAVLKKLIATYMRWELKNRSIVAANPDTLRKVIDDGAIDRESEAIAKKSLPDKEETGKK